MHKQTIALIDDDRNILTSLSIALEKEGFQVQTYIDGESALIGLTRTTRPRRWKKGNGCSLGRPGSSRSSGRFAERNRSL